MMLDNNYYIFLCFMAIILLIAYLWIKNNMFEGFDSSDTSTTIDKSLPSEVITQINTIQQDDLKSLVNEQVLELANMLDRYATLDIPIIINDKGQLCASSNQSKTNQSSNSCYKDSESDIYTCQSENGFTNSCMKFYSDGFITNKNNINISPLLINGINKIIANKNNIENVITNMDKTTNELINKYADLNNIELQQRDVIENNKNNMNDKQRLMEDNKKILKNKKTTTDINKNNFQISIENITNNEYRNKLYYNIIIGIIIAIIITGICNFLFSNILS